MTINNARKMTTDLFNDPFFIGFDRVLNQLNHRTPGQSDNYPPYNIVKVDEENYTIELAVAGFVESEIDIEIKEGILYLEGRKGEDSETTFLHKGISARAFRRSFTLSDTIVVRGADLENGILTINLENVIPDEKKPRKITIGKDDKSSSKKTLLTE